MKLESRFLKQTVVFSDSEIQGLYDSLLLDNVSLEQFTDALESLLQGVVTDEMDSENNEYLAALAFDIAEALHEIYVSWGLYDLYAKLRKVYRPSPLQNPYVWEGENASTIHAFFDNALNTLYYGK